VAAEEVAKQGRLDRGSSVPVMRIWRVRMDWMRFQAT
jgi:hypothetical protein